MNRKLENKVAVVTGASVGIGVQISAITPSGNLPADPAIVPYSYEL
jgi:hypothetical protein